MVGAHQNLNGSRDLTTPLSGTVCHPWLALATINLSTKFDVFDSTHYEDKTRKAIQNIENDGVVWGS